MKITGWHVAVCAVVMGIIMATLVVIGERTLDNNNQTEQNDVWTYGRVKHVVPLDGENNESILFYIVENDDIITMPFQTNYKTGDIIVYQQEWIVG